MERVLSCKLVQSLVQGRSFMRKVGNGELWPIKGVEWLKWYLMSMFKTYLVSWVMENGGKWADLGMYVTGMQVSMMRKVTLSISPIILNKKRK